MSYHMFLDDERMPGHVTWIALPNAVHRVVRNYAEFVDMIEQNGVPVFVSFDHDLADFHYSAMLREVNGEQNVDYGAERTGYDCAKWLVDYCADHDVKFPSFVVHSMNPIGRERIEKYIENAKQHLNI